MRDQTNDDPYCADVCELIEAIALDKPLWPNSWCQDVAFLAYTIHAQQKLLHAYEQKLGTMARESPEVH